MLEDCVMAGLDPAIQIISFASFSTLDGRLKGGHD
jgi:hypothetical protein